MRHRLICFPHAGAGASYYVGWPALLPPEIDVIAVQLPGREDRFRERPFTRAQPLLSELQLALRPYLQGSFSFFGHSGGALLAYELARVLHERRRAVPVHLMLSGQLAPGVPNGLPLLHALPDAEFRAAVRALGGLPEEVFGDDDLMDLVLPSLRADFALWETCQFPDRTAVPSSITVLAGDADDRAPTAKLAEWRRHTTGNFEIALFEGGHFYLSGPNKALLSTVSSILLCPAEASGTRTGS